MSEQIIEDDGLDFAYRLKDTDVSENNDDEELTSRSHYMAREVLANRADFVLQDDGWYLFEPFEEE